MKRTLSLSTIALLVLLCAAGASAATKKAVHPKQLPTGRPFSPGILVGDTLYVSGFVGNDIETGKAPEEFEAEVKQCLENIGLVLREAKMSYDNVVAVQVYLTDISLFDRMNKVYVSYFKEPRPTRTTVGVVKLAGPFRIEITVTARK